MKGKFEDKLAQLAFGELTPEEAAKIEREVHGDPEALRALSLYKDMKEGLRSLSEVPEDQFSKERLRDAILTQGLRPVAPRPTSSRSWLWMPTAACVMGFSLMFVMNMTRKSHGAPHLVIDEGSISLGISSKEPIRVASRVDTNAIYGPFLPANVRKADTAGESAKAVDPNEENPRILTSIPSDDAYDPDLGTLPATGSAAAGSASTVAFKGSTTAASGSTSGPIVLIDQDTDEQTGACKATEVGSSSNVLVGG